MNIPKQLAACVQTHLACAKSVIPKVSLLIAISMNVYKS